MNIVQLLSNSKRIAKRHFGPRLQTKLFHISIGNALPSIALITLNLNMIETIIFF